MSKRSDTPTLTDLRPRLTVIGVGGAGCNAVNNMIAAGLTGAEFVVANTDAQALAASSAEYRIQLGRSLTEGMGAGAKPEIGEASAEEAIEEIRAQIQGSHMVFLAAGMGGGTGTGAAAVIARISREMGILTVGVVTKPFQFEGTRRMRMAEAGIATLREHVDTLIVIPNQNLFRIANEKTTFAEAFVLADQVLYSGVACIVDLIVKEGLINLDFADVRSVMCGMGTAMMGTGEAEGERRAILAAEEAISNPLLDEISLKGAKGLLLSITGGSELTLYEVDEAATRVRKEVDPDANIIVGATFDDSLGSRIRVSIVASGMPSGQSSMPTPGAPQVSARPSANALGATASGPPPMPQPAGNAGHPAASAQPPAPPQAEPPRPVGNPAPVPALSVDGHGGLFGRTPHVPGQREPRADRDAATNRGEADDDLERRLAEAMRLGDDADGDNRDDPMFAATPVESRTAAALRSSWTAPGDVVIEEGLPPFGAAASPTTPSGAPSQSPGEAVTTGSAAFQPQVPVEIRRPPRRMPDVDDFPVVGQRDYRAKSTTAEPDPSARDGQRGAARKPGLFDRIAGLGRWGSDSAESPGPPARGERVTPGADEPYARQAASRADQRASARPDSGTKSQPNEIPAFFNKDRR
ncbi:MAG: cell division protein FtsZ [Hyphomicrobiaceae bacterium]|nr:cell division protein FtsZ [Hyphomicrobiaceae bacterium]